MVAEGPDRGFVGPSEDNNTFEVSSNGSFYEVAYFIKIPPTPAPAASRSDAFAVSAALPVSAPVAESDTFEDTEAVTGSRAAEASWGLEGSVVIAPSALLDGGNSGFAGSQDWTRSNVQAWSDAYAATLMIPSDNIGNSPGFGRSQALKYSLAFVRSSEITASSRYLETAWSRSWQLEGSGRLEDSMKRAESLAVEGSGLIWDSNRLDGTAIVGATLGFSGSEWLRKSNGFWRTAAYPPTVQVGSRAFNANSESVIASQRYLASGDPNETIDLGGTGAGPASGQFGYSSPLGESIPFQRSMTVPTGAGALELSDSNERFPVGDATSELVPVATKEISAFRETANFGSASHAMGNHMILWLIGVVLLLLVGAAVWVWFYLHRSEEESNGSEAAFVVEEEQVSIILGDACDFTEQENPLVAVSFDADGADACFEASVAE
jgi:hypothetical protein